MKKIIELPLGMGRLGLAFEKQGNALTLGGISFGTKLTATHIRDGRVVEEHDLGSGLVTNIGVLALANDMNWAAPAGAAINLFKLLRWHASGIGVAAAAATDYRLQTNSAVGGQTPISGTQVFTPADNLQRIVSVATIAYTGVEAVTEWGLFNRATLNDTTGTPATATSATSLTATATPFTASSTTVQGRQQEVLHTTTTPRIALVTSNSTSVLTIPNWLVDTTGATGAAPGATEAFSTRPVMWDRKVFAAINVVNGDSVQYTYALTISSGG